MANKKLKKLLSSLTVEELECNVKALLGEEPKETKEELVEQLVAGLPDDKVYELETLTEETLSNTLHLQKSGFVVGEHLVLEASDEPQAGISGASVGPQPEYLGHLTVLRKVEKVVNGNRYIEVRTSDGAVRLFTPEEAGEKLSTVKAEVPPRG